MHGQRQKTKQIKYGTVYFRIIDGTDADHSQIVSQEDLITMPHRKMNQRIPDDVLAEYWFDARHAAYENMLKAFERMHAEEGLKQEDIASRLNKDKGYISRCMRGQDNLTFRTLSNLARAMDCRLEVSFQVLKDLPVSNYWFTLAEVGEEIEPKEQIEASSPSEMTHKMVLFQNA